MFAIPDFKLISASRSSKLSPVEKKSEKSKDNLFGIDDMLNNPKTWPMAWVPLSNSFIWPSLIANFNFPFVWEKEKSFIDPFHEPENLASSLPPLIVSG